MRAITFRVEYVRQACRAQTDGYRPCPQNHGNPLAAGLWFPRTGLHAGLSRHVQHLARQRDAPCLLRGIARADFCERCLIRRRRPGPSRDDATRWAGHSERADQRTSRSIKLQLLLVAETKRAAARQTKLEPHATRPKIFAKGARASADFKPSDTPFIWSSAPCPEGGAPL